MKGVLRNIKRGSYTTDNSPTVSIFNWKPIPLEKTIVDMATSISEILKREEKV
jgi:dihydroflavonol-4-reductase